MARWLGSALVTAGGTWSMTLSTLGAGTHGILATATSTLGAVSLPNPLSVTIDPTPPPAASVGLSPLADTGTPGDGVTAALVPVLTGSAEFGATVTVTEGGVSLGSTTSLLGSYSLPLFGLTPGAHALQATVTDAAGNVSAATPYALTIDTAVPGVPTVALAAGSDTGLLADGLTADTTPTLTGTGEAGATVTIRDGLVTVGTALVDGSGNWSTTLSPLLQGLHALAVTQADVAGNASTSATLTLTIDTAAPPPPAALLDIGSDSGLPGDGITSDTTAHPVGHRRGQ